MAAVAPALAGPRCRGMPSSSSVTSAQHPSAAGTTALEGSDETAVDSAVSCVAARSTVRRSFRFSHPG
jgi:hypothetical protein